jgi:hypothetical protein
MEGSVKASGVDVGPKVGTEEGVSVFSDSVGIGRGVAVRGLALCVSAKAVPTVEMAVSMISASLIVGVD